jgi:glycosyltransferase involved in cell wall biosynthesis
MLQPLVTVSVVTYNSAAFVVETLQSVAEQTYQNIALIISDDGSTDNTVQLCEQWLHDHKGRFESIQLLTVPFNTGVSANCNRILAAAKTDWIKFIAGDDLLLPNCLEDYMQYVAQHPQVRVLFSQIYLFVNQFIEKNILRLVPSQFPANIMDPRFTAADQFKLLLVSDRINFTPSYFFHKEVILKVGGYDERHKIVEDYPMWLKLTQAGYRLDFMQKITVAYRQHNQSTNNKEKRLLIKHSVLNTYSFRKEFVHPFLPWDMVWGERITMQVGGMFNAIGWNKDKPFYRTMFVLLTVYLNPFRYISYLKKTFLKTDPVFYSRG